MAMDIRFPAISGGSDRERIDQIIRYLYQLVEQLNLSMTDPGTGSSDVLAESGMGDGWLWKKYRGGTYLAFGRFDRTVSGSSPRGALYQTNAMTFPLPFAVTDAYVSGTAVGAFLPICAEAGGRDSVTLRFLSAEAIPDGTRILVDLMVMGTYSTQKEV